MLQKIFFVSQVNKVSFVESADGREAVVKISSRETRVQVVVSRLLLTFTALFFFLFMSRVRPSGRSAKKCREERSRLNERLENS